MSGRVRSEHPSWQGTGVTPVFQQHLSVDDGIVNTLGEFPDTPPTGREVMHDIFGKRFNGVGIEMSCRLPCLDGAARDRKYRRSMPTQRSSGVPRAPGT